MSPVGPAPATPLTVAQRDGLAQLLARGLAQRREQLSARQGQQSLVDHARSERQQDSDEVMQRSGEREVDAALSERDLDEVDRLNAALRRIDAGIYGICVDCAEPIGFQRLLAQPEALRCSACEAVHEGRDRVDPGL